MAGDPGAAYRLFWRSHRAIDRATGGRVDLARLIGAPSLWLTTVGRRTGEVRENALWYVQAGLTYVVVGTHVGSDRQPAWFLNLMASPDTSIRIGRRTRLVHARRAWGDEAERLWTAFTTKYPSARRYRSATERELPVVVLEPR